MIEKHEVVVEQELMQRVIVRVLKNQRIVLVGLSNLYGSNKEAGKEAFDATNDLISELED